VGSISRRRATLALLLLATALGAPAATLALPTDAPDLNATRRADSPSMSSVWDQPATPAPVVIVRPQEAQAAAPERTLSPNPLWEIPLSSLSTTRERPIFSPSRRPPPPVVAAAPPAPAPPPPPKPPRVERPQLSLVGTVGGGEESFAIFVDLTTKAALRLKIGEDYQGWKLRAVQGREVTLERDQQTTILSLPQPGTAVQGPVLPRARGEGATEQRQTDPQRDERR
jgi:general secretion pathway protein N